MIGRRRDADPPRVLIIVQNLPVPFDRRVWLECQSLVGSGYDVTVVCPRGEGTGAEQVVDGVRILAYPPYAPGGGAAGFFLEYAYSFLATAWLAFRARRRGAFTVVQACNPPDIFWPLAWALRVLDGSRFVFDHHDLCPELVRVAVPERLARLPPGPAVPRAGDLPYRGPGHLHQRVVCRYRHLPGRQGTRARHRRADRARPATPAPDRT
ncbi:glycosyltransferase [Nostocoides sp. HKS02]|uniref:glycosyltransferase n=1 Tax=Nostocoides sp. HKS02 TaxID=1813880 RepID=UPI001E5500CA|nr:glycosyltransferase [Tetrasphaera sp. HKS02]